MRKLRTIEMQRLTLEQFHQAEKLPLVVVLDDVRSMHNVGAVFRTADAFRLEAVCLCGITGQPPHAEIHKTALGAEDSVEDLKSGGAEVLALEQAEGSAVLSHFHPQKGKRYAIVLGNEVKGVHQEVVDACHGCLEIPQFGTKHSLNVSVTAGIAIYHFSEEMRA